LGILRPPRGFHELEDQIDVPTFVMSKVPSLGEDKAKAVAEALRSTLGDSLCEADVRALREQDVDLISQDVSTRVAVRRLIQVLVGESARLGTNSSPAPTFVAKMENPLFEPNARVRLKNLKSAPQHNGAEAIVVNRAEGGLYRVLLNGTSYKMNAGNMELISPEQHVAETMSAEDEMGILAWEVKVEKTLGLPRLQMSCEPPVNTHRIYSRWEGPHEDLCYTDIHHFDMQPRLPLSIGNTNGGGHDKTDAKDGKAHACPQASVEPAGNHPSAPCCALVTIRKQAAKESPPLHYKYFEPREPLPLPD